MTDQNKDFRKEYYKKNYFVSDYFGVPLLLQIVLQY